MKSSLRLQRFGGRIDALAQEFEVIVRHRKMLGINADPLPNDDYERVWPALEQTYRGLIESIQALDTAVEQLMKGGR